MNATTTTVPTESEDARYADLQLLAIDAARDNDHELLRPMLLAGLPVNLQDAKGNTLLMLAAYHGHVETVRLLLEHGADPDRRNDRNQTPLGGVAFKGHLEIARLLVASGANPAADQGGGQTPLMFATLFGRLETARYLRSLTPRNRFSGGLDLLARLKAWLRRRRQPS